MRDDLQQVAKDALGEREGSVVVMDPTTGAVQAMWSFPSYDPNLVVDPDFDRARRRAHVPAGVARRSAARQRLPAALHAGLDVQGADDEHRPAGRRGEPRHRVPRRAARGCRRRPTTRSRTSRARRAAATSPRCSRAAATSRSPSWPSTSASDRMVQGVADWGVGEPVPIDLPRPAASTFGTDRRPGAEPPAAGHPRLRPERGADGAAAHGDGRRRPSPTAGR